MENIWNDMISWNPRKGEYTSRQRGCRSFTKSVDIVFLAEQIRYKVCSGRQTPLICSWKEMVKALVSSYDDLPNGPSQWWSANVHQLIVASPLAAIWKYDRIQEVELPLPAHAATPLLPAAATTPSSQKHGECRQSAGRRHTWTQTLPPTSPITPGRRYWWDTESEWRTSSARGQRILPDFPPGYHQGY